MADAVDTHHLDLGKAFIGLQTRIATTSGLPKFEWLKDTSYFLSNGALADQLFVRKWSKFDLDTNHLGFDSSSTSLDIRRQPFQQQKHPNRHIH